jgi:hypothetical protein
VRRAAKLLGSGMGAAGSLVLSGMDGLPLHSSACVTAGHLLHALLPHRTHRCSDDCGWEIYQQVTSKTFMPVPKCISTACVANGNPGRVNLHVRTARTACA